MVVTVIFNNVHSNVYKELPRWCCRYTPLPAGLITYSTWFDLGAVSCQMHQSILTVQNRSNLFTSIKTVFFDNVMVKPWDQFLLKWTKNGFKEKSSKSLWFFFYSLHKYRSLTLYGTSAVEARNSSEIICDEEEQQEQKFNYVLQKRDWYQGK